MKLKSILTSILLLGIAFIVESHRFAHTFFPYKSRDTITFRPKSKCVVEERRHNYKISMIDLEGPHVVQIRIMSQKSYQVGPTCVGALIQKNFVLTAAQCFFCGIETPIYYRRDMRVYIWSKFTNVFEKVNIENIHIHPKFYIFKNLNDLALIKLKDNTKLKVLKPVKVPYYVNTERESSQEEFIKDRYKQIFLQTRAPTHGGDFFSVVKKRVHLQKNEFCHKRLPHVFYSEHHFCTQVHSDLSMDYLFEIEIGAPLIEFDSLQHGCYVLGVTSRLNSTVKARYVRLYTNLGRHLKWIAGVTQESSYLYNV